MFTIFLGTWAAWVLKKKRAIINQSHLPCFGQGMVPGSTVCALVINLTCSVLASIPRDEQAHFWQAEMRNISARLVFH